MSRFSSMLVPVVAVFAAGAAAAADPPAARVRSVDVRSIDGRVEVVIQADAPPTFQSIAKTTPPEIVVDLLDTDAAPTTLRQKGDGVLTAVDVVKTKTGARVVLKLKEAVLYDVSATGDTVTATLFVGPEPLTFKAKPGAKVAMATTKSDVRSDVGMMGKATAPAEIRLAQDGPKPTRQMTYIGFRNEPGQSVVFARLNDKADYEVKKEGENLLVLEIRNATIPLRNNKNHLDTTFFDSPVKMVTPTEVEDATPSIRIIIEMKEMVPYETKLNGRDIVVSFKRAAG
jgi:hypothetical protein